MDANVRLRLNSRLVPALVLVLLVVQFIAPYDGWLILLVGLGAAWLAAYLWARSLARHLRLRREMRYGWAQVGDRLEERFTLNNSGLLPAIWVEVRDHTLMPGYQVSRSTGVSAHSSNRWTTQSVCHQRGLFQLGPTSLLSGDPLGIYQVEIHNPDKTSLLVTPPVVPLPSIHVAAGGRAGEGRPRPDAPERTVSAAGVREFTPGDSLRWIHWRTSARKQKFYVQLFDGTPAGDWWILLDMDRSAQAGSGQDSTEEHSVILAASLAERGLRSGKAVGVAAGGDKTAWLPPSEGSGQRWRLLRSLAMLSTGTLSLGQMLARIQPALGQRASLLIITANTREDWLPSLLPLMWAGAVPTVLLFDPATFGAENNASGLAHRLGDLGIAHYVIPRELLDRPEVRPGQRGKWEWRIMPTGRAVAVSRPDDLEWKELG
jgi:uncharacterized protein (DUF58 family)